MNYADIRDRLTSGDIIALTHTSWDTLYDWQIQAIRVFDRTEYVHVGMVWVVKGRVFVIESVTPYVRLVPLSKFAKEGFYWIPLGKRMSDAELEEALSMVGVARYSKWEAIKAFFRRVRIGANAKWECAEALIHWRRLSGVELGSVATPSAVVRAAQILHSKPVYFVSDESNTAYTSEQLSALQSPSDAQ